MAHRVYANSYIYMYVSWCSFVAITQQCYIVVQEVFVNEMKSAMDAALCN